MTRIAHSKRGLVRDLSLAAVALLILAVAPSREASATSLITPSVSPLAKQTSEGLTIEVRGGHGGGHGGGGWHGGGGHGGWHHGGGGWHGGWHHGGGGWHRGWHGGWHGGWRGGGYFHHRRFYGGYYPYYYHPSCRIVWTYWGPRRICGYHHWYGWHRRYWHRRYW
jgi:hypothetical protein